MLVEWLFDGFTIQNIVEELMTHLETADPAIREEMVLKIAIIAEKYANDLNWYGSFLSPRFPLTHPSCSVLIGMLRRSCS